MDAAIDAAGLPWVFHSIAERESGDDPYAVNPYSGACSWAQFMPYVAASYGYSCDELMDPYTAAHLAKIVYDQYRLAPWQATAY